MHSCAVCVTIFSNGSTIPTSFKFTELHALTLAARSYVLLNEPIERIVDEMSRWNRQTTILLVIVYLDL